MLKRLFALVLASLAYAGADAQTSVIFTPSTQQACTAACVTAFTPPPPTVELANTPDAMTTKTTASISWTGKNVAAVWCRRDGFAPIKCPQPFTLGAASPLDVGSHRVDFYGGTDAAADTSKALASYVWVVQAPPIVVPPPVVTPPSATALAVLQPVGWEGNGVDGYTGKSVFGSDGIARLLVNADGTYTQRIKLGDPEMYGGNRAEFGWSGSQNMVHGVDYWWSFAFRPKPGEYHGNEPGTSDQVFFQIHQSSSTACCGPTFALMTSGNGNALAASRVYGASPKGSEEYPMFKGATNSRPADGAWSRFVVHIKFGPTAGVIQVWQNGALIIDRSGSAGAIGQSGESSYYTKIGFYKWNEDAAGYGLVKSRAADYSPLFFGQGADLKASADASTAGYK